MYSDKIDSMNNKIFCIALLVSDYDEAIAYYTKVLNFLLIEDTQLTPSKRWVVVAPGKDAGCQLLLAKAADEMQRSRVGNQTGGRVFLFLQTDDFYSEYNRMLQCGVDFVRPPAHEEYGIVAVFKDVYGNLWDLIQPNNKS